MTSNQDTMSIYKCPHCCGLVAVLPGEMNCRVFRHGVFIADGTQIPPHAPEPDCNRWAEEKLIHGCGKPFTYDGTKMVPCGYI